MRLNNFFKTILLEKISNNIELEAAEITGATINYENLAKIILLNKREMIEQIIKNIFNKLSKENKIIPFKQKEKEMAIAENKNLLNEVRLKRTPAEEKLKVIVEKITINRLRKAKNINELIIIKNKALIEAKDTNSLLFKKIEKELGDDLRKNLKLTRITNSIRGAFNDKSGNTFENLVKKQLKEKKDEPVIGLWSLITLMFWELYDIDINTSDDFLVRKSKSPIASFDIQIIYKSMNFSFINIHCKFLMKKTTITGMKWQQPSFKTNDLAQIEQAIYLILKIDKSKLSNYIIYPKPSKKTRSFLSYRVNVKKIFEESGIDNLNKNINSVRVLLRLFINTIFVIDDRAYRIKDIERIEKNKKGNYVLKSKEGEELFKFQMGSGGKIIARGFDANFK